MFWASRSSSLPNIIELVDHGADVNYVAQYDSLGIDDHVFRKTPLFKARTKETIKLLLSFGADPSYKALKTVPTKSPQNMYILANCVSFIFPTKSGVLTEQFFCVIKFQLFFG